MPEQTTHPSPDELSAFSLGQLPPEEAAVVESHISECQPCCETMLSLSSDDTFVALLQEAKQLPTEQSPTDETFDHDGSQSKPPSSFHDVPAPLAEHPRYEIVGLIGKGGMGDVYQARHRKMERTVALKVINRGLVRKPEAVERFHREVKTAGQLSHPNIVTAYDADQAGDFHFMVMEYVDGVDLSQTVKSRGPLPVVEACEYIRQAAIGLQHAHERGMVHRDIKPHNLMVMADGTVKILDFGLASLSPETIAAPDTVEARGDLTAAGAIMGTPDFISPEQANDARQADIRSDIYSLGATLYFLLTGRPLFADGSVMHKLKSHAQAEPEPLESLRDEIPADLAGIVSKMIAKDPADRFQTPAEAVAALESFARARQEEISKSSPGHHVQPRRWKPRFLSLAAIAALSVASLFAGLIYYVQTNHGVVRVEVTDPSLQVSINDHTITMKYGDGKPLTIRPGEQSLIVRKDEADFEFETDSFQIRRGDRIAFKVEYVKGEVVVRKDGERFDSKALPDDVKVEQILDRMAKAYAQCESYRDSGVIKTVIVENTDSPQITFEHSLTTVFERPDRFRFEIKDEDDDKLLISVNGQNVQTWRDIEPGIQKPESLEIAMAQAIGFTGGDVGRIPAMLMPQRLGGWVDLDLIDPKPIEDGELQNIECFRLEYSFRDEQVTLWIDKQSYLVRRIDERIKADDVRIERTTTYDPTIDGKITDQMLEFDPPAPRAADADTHKAGQQRSDNQFDMPLCWCPAGEFKMGREQLPVTLTRGFWMGKYEVTQAQYEALMGENPSENKGEALPVEKVAWNEAKKFCQKFTELERKAGRLPKGWEYRLPTEAQWEYACRAGTTLVWDDEKALVYPSTFGDDLSELGDYAWYSANSDGTPHPGGQKKPNAWGLCDMYGNVREWVRDAWQSKLSGGKDPEVDVSSTIHARRGGDWLSYAEPCGSPFIRGFGTAGLEVHMMGFRVALVPVGDSGDGAAAGGDLRLLQGDWDVIAFTQNGKKEIAADRGVGMLVQIKGDTITRIQTAPNGEKSEKEWGRIELSSATVPKSIDIVNPDGPGGRLLGIYELTDGGLMICFAERSDIDVAEGKPVKRPTTFDAPAESELVLLECQRDINDPDLKQLQGEADFAPVGGQSESSDEFEREVAIWVLENGGTVVLKNTVGRLEKVENLDDLPNRPFTITHIGLKNAKDEDLKRLEGLSLTTLSLSGEQLTDAGLAYLVRVGPLNSLFLKGCPRVSLSNVFAFRDVKTLKLNNTPAISDEALESLNELLSIQYLDIGENKQFTDEALVHIAELKTLDYLVLESTAITDAGLKHLAPLDELLTLDLSSTAIGDAGLKHLAPLDQLYSLNLSSTEITDGGLKHLAQLEELFHLNLSSTAITDAGLKHLASTDLFELNLDSTATSDTGLKQLASMDELGKLSLSGTLVTAQGIEELRETRSEEFQINWQLGADDGEQADKKVQSASKDGTDDDVGNWDSAAQSGPAGTSEAADRNEEDNATETEAESAASTKRKTTGFLVEAVKRGDLNAVKAALGSGVDPNGPRDRLTALHWAVAQRVSGGKTIEPSPEIARRLIEAGANVNAQDYLGQTPLEWAATHAPPEVVTMLIKAGADVNAESRYGTVLMAARRVEIAELLIEAGADVNAGKLTSPLATAAKYGNAELIHLLVENGANVNDPRDPPIHWAGKPEAAKALLEVGADVNQRNRNGDTALHLAKSTWSPNAETVKLLIEAGADVKAANVTGATPLHAAVQMAKPKIAELVIAAGADVDAKDKQGNTPLSLAHASLASARGQQQVDNRPYEAVVQVLVDAGAKDDGRTELQQAVAAGDLQKAKELIAAKVDVNETGPQRITAVHIASEKGHAEILAALIEAGANVDIPDALGLRPLHLAVNAEIARLLIAKGAKVNSRMPSPLYMATMNGKADVVRELVQSETAVNDSDCGEILNWATFAGQLEVVKVLFELRDEDTLLKTPSTYSPLHVATSGSFGGMNSPHDVTSRQRLDIAKLLVEKGADVNARWGANVNPQSGAAHMIDTTPLMFASSQGDIEMVKFLIDQQADAKAANASGQTALHFASQHGHRSVVELLLDANADVNALTREAKTPLDVAQDAAVKILLIQKDGKTASEILEDSQ